MPSTMSPFSAIRALAFRPSRRALIPSQRAAPQACRFFADNSSAGSGGHNALPEAEPGEQGPNMQQQEHVSEEAAKMAKMTGGEGPDIEGQGTNVQDILRDEKEARKQAPQVMKDALKKEQSSTAKSSTGTRSFSTSARRHVDISPNGDFSAGFEPSMIPSDAQRSKYALENAPSMSQEVVEESKKGHKFPLPSLPLGPNAHKDYRYDPVVEQVTNLIMRSGKKARAQSDISTVLTHLRTAPAPTYSTTRPLLPGAPPASHLPLHPILYLTLALDSVAPLLRIRSQRGAAGGGVALQIPVPLGLRQRRRQAFQWILDAASKRKNSSFAIRLAEEIVAVVEGRSSVWERRLGVHRLGTTARSNLSFGTRGRR